MASCFLGMRLKMVWEEKRALHAMQLDPAYLNKLADFQKKRGRQVWQSAADFRPTQFDQDLTAADLARLKSEFR